MKGFFQQIRNRGPEKNFVPRRPIASVLGFSMSVKYTADFDECEKSKISQFFIFITIWGDILKILK